MCRSAVLVAAAGAVTLVACSSNGGQPGNPDVYARIEGETDCVRLQREFDVAYENHEIQSEEGDLKMMRISTSYMEAADERMRNIGCYR